MRQPTTQCDRLLHAYGEDLVRCDKPKGHRGEHRWPPGGRETANKNLAVFMRKAVNKT